MNERSKNDPTTSISIVGTRDLLVNETRGLIQIDSRLVVIESIVILVLVNLAATVTHFI
jgi:hypothetical protein